MAFESLAIIFRNSSECIAAALMKRTDVLRVLFSYLPINCLTSLVSTVDALASLLVHCDDAQLVIADQHGAITNFMRSFFCHRGKKVSSVQEQAMHRLLSGSQRHLLVDAAKAHLGEVLGFMSRGGYKPHVHLVLEELCDAATHGC
jgi:hypothetical protein